MSQAVVKIGADLSEFSRALKGAGGEMASFAKQVASVATGQALFAGIGAAANAAGSIIRGMGETFRESINIAGEFEAVVAQFTTFYKSADTAQGAVAELAKYAATTSFQLSEVASAGASLAGVGVPAEQLKESIRVLGDIAAGTKRPLAEILQPYVKAMSVGKMQTETFIQFLERGIPIGEELKKALNLDDAGLQKALTAGTISAQDMVNALQAMTTTGLFSGAAAAQGTTINGVLSTLKDNVDEIKRNLGLAASEGLKPLVTLAQGLAGRFAPIGTALGNIFTAATAKALQFSDKFSAGFGKAVDFAVNAFQIIEGAIKNGTLWDILKTSGTIAFVELANVAVKTFQGLGSVISELPDLQTVIGGGVKELGKMFGSSMRSELPSIATEIGSSIGKALLDAAKEWADFLFRTVTFVPRLISSAFTPNLPDIPTVNGIRQDRPSSPNAAGMTSAQAQEIVAAKAAGYPTPLTPGEVRETFAGGKRITYNTKESLSNGAIIPPSNSEAFAEGTPGQSVLAAFERGFNKQTTATERLQNQNEKLRMELAKLTDAALKNATAIREQSASLKSTSELTAKQGQAAAEDKGKEKGKGFAKTDDAFTSLQKIGGGARRINLAAGPAIEMEGKEPGLKAAGDLGVGFANSPRFEQVRKRNEMMKLPVQGPPIAPFLQMQRQQGAPQMPAPQGPDPEADLRRMMEEISRALNGVTAAIVKQGSLNVAVV